MIHPSQINQETPRDKASPPTASPDPAELLQSPSRALTPAPGLPLVSAPPLVSAAPLISAAPLVSVPPLVAASESVAPASPLVSVSPLVTAPSLVSASPPIPAPAPRALSCASVPPLDSILVTDPALEEDSQTSPAAHNAIPTLLLGSTSYPDTFVCAKETTAVTATSGSSGDPAPSSSGHAGGSDSLGTQKASKKTPTTRKAKAKANAKKQGYTGKYGVTIFPLVLLPDLFLL